MLTPEERKDAIKGVPEGLNLLNELIDERRKNPGDDFLSTLILAEDQGSKLSNLEMCALVGAVLGAGSDTAVDLHSKIVFGATKMISPKTFQKLFAGKNTTQWDSFECAMPL